MLRADSPEFVMAGDAQDTGPIGPRGIRGIFRKRNGWDGTHHLVKVDFGDWQCDMPEVEYRDALYLPEFEDLPWKDD
jgi:hypothetical protein